MKATHSCCCCLVNTSDKALRTPHTCLGVTEIYSDMLEECFQVHLVRDNNEEYGICSVCVGRLRDARDFKLQVQRSQTELRARLDKALQDKALQDKASDDEPLLLETADGDGARGESMLHDEAAVKMETSEEDGTADEILHEQSPGEAETEAADATSDEEFVSRLQIDEDVEKLLKSWDLEDYVTIFADNKITLKALGLLDSQLIKELITPVGDRVRFTKRLAEWKKITDCLQEESGSSVDIFNKPTNIIEECTSSEQILSAGPDNIQTFILSPASTSNAGTDIETLEFCHEDNKCTKLTDLLHSTQEGKGLLNMHQENGLLSNNARRKVCNIIIKHLLEEDINKRVSCSTLLDYAQQITEIFKKENVSTYCIPYKSNTKLKIRKLAKGKLYDCLQNRKREFRAAYKTKKENTGPQSSAVSEILPQDQDSDTAEDITWLKHCSDPFDMVIKKWQNTFKIRRAKILHNPENTVANYMKTYPCLNKPTGFHLLVDDFKNLYPDSFEKLKEEFPLYKDEILNLTVKKFTRHPDVNAKDFAEECLKIGNQESSADLVEISSIYAFMYLPLLLGNPLKNIKKTAWRPSKQESRDAFITHLTTATELKGTIAARKEKYAKQGLEFQPAIFIVGPTIQEIETYYIVVNDSFYVVNSILEAVDVTFKLYHALHCEYPMECKTVYSFLQKAFYKISTKWDKEFTSVNILLADLNIR